MSVEAIEARWVIPVEPDGTCLDHHTVILSDDTIKDLLPTEEARIRYPGIPRSTFDSHVVIPGLVNAHTHAAMTLMRGMADDLPLMRWLEEHIWPAEIAHVSPEFVKDGTALAVAECLRGGVTCFNDMYFYPETAAQAALDMGIRMAVGMIVIEFPTRYASDPQDYLAKGLATRDDLRDQDLLSFCLAPHAPYTVSDGTFAKVSVLADQLDVPIHVHLHETSAEIQQSMGQHGCRPLERLARLGLLTPRLVGVHAVHLMDEEIAALAEHGCSVVHCPSSNLKLASGFARVADLSEAGVNVALGTDGAASNNRLDMFEEMRLAAFLAKATSGRAEVVAAHDALRMATLCGAQALGLDPVIGSIAVGKKADLVAVNLDELDLAPCFDPVSHLVYAASRRDVTDVWVAGKRRVSASAVVHSDIHGLRERVAYWQSRLQN
ncbi:MAG: TRZ/ATZ family hydrolase [Betaproteobacteria bacterium]|nr:TRZ/ATZ family hydrolase [Betaproteobacteria bacterium]